MNNRFAVSPIIYGSLNGADLMAHLVLCETVDTLGHNSLMPLDKLLLNTIAVQCAKIEHGITRLKIIKFLVVNPVQVSLASQCFALFFGSFANVVLVASKP